MRYNYHLLTPSREIGSADIVSPWRSNASQRAWYVQSTGTSPSNSSSQDGDVLISRRPCPHPMATVFPHTETKNCCVSFKYHDGSWWLSQHFQFSSFSLWTAMLSRWHSDRDNQDSLALDCSQRTGSLTQSDCYILLPWSATTWYRILSSCICWKKEPSSAPRHRRSGPCLLACHLKHTAHPEEKCNNWHFMAAHGMYFCKRAYWAYFRAWPLNVCMHCSNSLNSRNWMTLLHIDPSRVTARTQNYKRS